MSVIDNTTGATLLSCTVTSSSNHSCSNTKESGSAAPGDNLEVKITAQRVELQQQSLAREVPLLRLSGSKRLKR